MALIYIKRRLEALEVDAEKARQIKDRWRGTEFIEKRKPTDQLDIGPWSGSYGEIASIDLTPTTAVTSGGTEKYLIEQERIEREILALKPEDRAKNLQFFKLTWYVRSGMREPEPPLDILDKAYKIALEYFKRNPRETRVNSDLFEPLLSKQFGPKKRSTQGLL